MTTEAIQALLTRHHQAGYGWAIGCCRGNRLEAEEVLQMVYLKILPSGFQRSGPDAAQPLTHVRLSVV